MANLTTLQDLFVKELRDTYDAEKQITKALPKMIKQAHREDLRAAFEEHQQQTLGQIERSNRRSSCSTYAPRACAATAWPASSRRAVRCSPRRAGRGGARCRADRGGAEGRALRDASYGTLVAYARTLGLTKVADLLAETLEEEKSTDQRLSRLAETGPNRQAANASR